MEQKNIVFRTFSGNGHIYQIVDRSIKLNLLVLLVTSNITRMFAHVEVKAFPIIAYFVPLAFE